MLPPNNDESNDNTVPKKPKTYFDWLNEEMLVKIFGNFFSAYIRIKSLQSIVANEIIIRCVKNGLNASVN